MLGDRATRSRPKVALSQVVDCRSGCERDARPTIRHEANAGEAQYHHCPCGGFGDGRYQHLSNKNRIAIPIGYLRSKRTAKAEPNWERRLSNFGELYCIACSVRE